MNYFSATLDVNIAFKLIENRLDDNSVHDPLVLIITPYRPQADIIRKIIRQEYENRGIDTTREIPNFIKVGTVHSFQGKEADIVIFDLVVDEPHWRTNLFMPDENTTSNMNMFNVAVTRAKFRLYIVGDFAFCRKRTSKGNALANLLSYLIDTARIPMVDAKKLFPQMSYNYRDGSVSVDNLKARHLWCREDSFEEYFMADVEQAKRQIVIYSPFLTENRVASLLPVLDNAINRGVRIVVVTKAMSDITAKSQKSAKQQCEKVLTLHDIRIIHRTNMHEKLIFIDETILWHGSLNVLSFSGYTGEIMERTQCDPNSEEGNSFDSCAKVCDLEHILRVIEDKDEQLCPICHQEMVLRESDNGGYYWQCENGKEYSRNTTQPHPKDGELRCQKCGGTFIYTRKKQPRWVCRNDNSHYQILKQNDLKLPKMRNLIEANYPPSEFIAIEEYFEQHK